MDFGNAGALLTCQLQRLREGCIIKCTRVFWQRDSWFSEMSKHVFSLSIPQNLDQHGRLFVPALNQLLYCGSHHPRIDVRSKIKLIWIVASESPAVLGTPPSNNLPLGARECRGVSFSSHSTWGNSGKDVLLVIFEWWVKGSRITFQDTLATVWAISFSILQLDEVQQAFPDVPREIWQAGTTYENINEGNFIENTKGRGWGLLMTCPLSYDYHTKRTLMSSHFG